MARVRLKKGGAKTRNVWANVKDARGLVELMLLVVHAHSGPLSSETRSSTSWRQDVYTQFKNCAAHVFPELGFVLGKVKGDQGYSYDAAEPETQKVHHAMAAVLRILCADSSVLKYKRDTEANRKKGEAAFKTLRAYARDVVGLTDTDSVLAFLSMLSFVSLGKVCAGTVTRAPCRNRCARRQWQGLSLLPCRLGPIKMPVVLDCARLGPRPDRDPTSRHQSF